MSDTTRFLLFHFFFCRFIFVCHIFPSFKQYQIPCFLSRNPLSHKPLYPSILYLFQKPSALLIHRPQFQYNRKQILFTHSIADHTECLIEKFVHFRICFPHNDRRVNDSCHLPDSEKDCSFHAAHICFVFPDIAHIIFGGIATRCCTDCAIRCDGIFFFSYFFDHRF